jgi:hypothetical protein
MVQKGLPGAILEGSLLVVGCWLAEIFLAHLQV